jgi:hypothetical protein
MTRPTWRYAPRDIPPTAVFDGVWLHGADKSRGTEGP